jgi:hypothetical protein
MVASHGGGYLPSYIGRSDNCHAKSQPEFELHGDRLFGM